MGQQRVKRDRTKGRGGSLPGCSRYPTRLVLGPLVLTHWTTFAIDLQLRAKTTSIELYVTPREYSMLVVLVLGWTGRFLHLSTASNMPLKTIYKN